MKYKLIKPMNPQYNAIEQILTNRNIPFNEIYHYLHTTDEDISNPEDFGEDKLKAGIKMLLSAIQNEKNMLVICDCDCDGFTSAALLCNYLHDLFPSYVENKLKWFVHEDKQHGLEDVMEYTKAGTGCGACKRKIQNYLEEMISTKSESSDNSVQFVLKINKVIDKYISNELRKDGGDIELVDVKGNIVYVKLSGNCQMCKNAQLTLKNFVENTLREHVNPDIIVEKV